MRVFLKICAFIFCWLTGAAAGLIFLYGMSANAWEVLLRGDGFLAPPTVVASIALCFGGILSMVTFAPPFFLLKDRALFWHPLIAIPSGLISGVICSLGATISGLFNGPVDERPLAWTPLVIGMATFAIGSVLKRYLLR